MSDLRNDAREALDAATTEIRALGGSAEKRALIKVLDAVALVAAIVGVPNAIESDGTPHVATKIDW